TAQFPPRWTTLKEATWRVMTQPTLLEAALQRAAAVASLLQGEVLGVADACVVLAETAAPLSLARRRGAGQSTPPRTRAVDQPYAASPGAPDPPPPTAPARSASRPARSARSPGRDQ